MIKSIIICLLCFLSIIIIGTIIKKKFNINKKVDYVVAMALPILAFIAVILLANLNNIMLYDMRIYLSLISCLPFGWILSSDLLKMWNKK